MKELYPGEFASWRLREAKVVEAELRFVKERVMLQTLDEIRALPSTDGGDER